MGDLGGSRSNISTSVRARAELHDHLHLLRLSTLKDPTPVVSNHKHLRLVTSKVCGRIRAYQYDTTDGFPPVESDGDHACYIPSVKCNYLSGISITHRGTIGDLSDPPTHRWSLW